MSTTLPSTFPDLNLEAIPPHGLVVSPGPWAVAPCQDGAEGSCEKVEGSLKITRHGVHIFVRGQLKAAVQLRCDRCGKALDWQIEGPLSCLYSPLSEVPERGEEDEDTPPLPVKLDEHVEDLGEYSGTSLDLRDVVREFFSLERPTSLRCLDIDADQDAACYARWKSEAGALSNEDTVLNPFSRLSGFKPSR